MVKLMKNARKRPARASKNIPFTIGIAAVLLLYCLVAILLPLPMLKPTVLPAQPSIRSTADIDWPPSGQSAIGVVGTAILSTHGVQKPVPTASTAKLLTALAVLRMHPINTSGQGATIAITAQDVAIYNKYVREDGSVVQVQAGESLSEYQMLEAMMLPSANNIADSLAIWAFGSLGAYAQYANQYAHQLGMSDTHVGSDASGYSPDTTSTASDLVHLGEAVEANPVLAHIVSLPLVSNFPVVGTITNVNQLLGVEQIDGIKTGNSNQAGGVFVSSSTTTISGKQVRIVTAYAGAPDLSSAFTYSLPLVSSAQSNFTTIQTLKSGEAIGSYALPWGGNVSAVVSKNLSSEVWRGSTVILTAQLRPIPTKSHADLIVGSITAQKNSFYNSQSRQAILNASIPQPSIWWHLLHPTGLFL
jgi:D-alanyl-D-alanine carboxypeptidase (penicillin-binding protein 5/6)